MQELDDTELLQRYADQNSEEAFSVLVARYVDLVYSTAWRKTGSPDAAQEITQAVFIILGKKAGSLRKETILSGWLHETTRLTAANFLRSETRRLQREQEAYMQSLSNEPEPDLWPAIAPLLDDALGTLSPKDRSAIVLRFFEGKSFEEVGSALSGTENAAKKRVSRALEKLRHSFLKRGVRGTTVVIAAAISAHSIQAAPVGLNTSIVATAVKGTTAATSTLTLVKGTIKLMAWTKMKIAAVTSTALILATISTVTVANHFRHTPPAQTGKLKLPTGNVTPMVAYGYSRYGLFLASNGSIWSWGEERLGWPVLGLGNIHSTVSLRRIGRDADWVNISAGDSHALAIKSDGTLWAWGGNFDYQLGDGTKTTRPTPVASIPGNDWKQAAAGGANSFALRNDGTLWAWGYNVTGQPGRGRAQDSIKAVQVGASTNWAKIWAGSIQTLGLQNDGSLWFWGSLTGDSKGPNQFNIPTRISSDIAWTDACFGYFTMFGIKSDGTLWSWGLKANFYTKAADESSNATPMQVGTENDWKSCASSPSCFYHILQKTDGSLWALDASEHRTVKEAKQYKPITLRKIDLHKDIAAFTAGGDNIGMVMTPDGEVWTWGRVVGEFAPKDYMSNKGEQLFPKSKDIDKPWQLSNLDETR
ncbi:MAG: regulator of chromosome condensation [Verrucomicrobiales bacterium]|nr:regulator of chromosome condensation [Verrucomicrobiales bacterium]